MRIKLFGRTWNIQAATSTLPALQSDSGWISYLNGRGYAVSADTALQISAVFRCVDIISKTIAALPLHMFMNTDKGKEKAVSHRVYPLVYTLPNYQTTAYEFWQCFVANLLLTRGAFAKIQRNSRGFITSLWNIPTSRVGGVYINQVNGERFIVVTLDAGSQETLREGEFLYTPGFIFADRNVPSDPMTLAAEVLGLTSTVANYAKQAVNSVNPGGFVEYPSQLSDKAYERFKLDFEANYKGVANAGKFLFLEEGGKAAMFERDMEKMQVLESRKYAVTEICRFFGVPAHLAMDMEHSTFSNIEQQNLEYVTYCVNPLSVRLEQSLYKDLLTETERSIFFFKFNTNALLRGDTAARTAYYNSARQNGWMNGDEIRRLEDLDIMPDGQGEIFTVNGNMIPLSAVPMNLPKGAQNVVK